ncbi:MAG: hypothetical protein ACI835_000919 [Planctomycetota bacterium]|jgi:hypothetical protein
MVVRPILGFGRRAPHRNYESVIRTAIEIDPWILVLPWRACSD